MLLLPVAMAAAMASVAPGQVRAQRPEPPSAKVLLEMYGRGDAEAAAALVDALPDDALEALGKTVRKTAPAWIEDRDAAVVRRRRLAAATLALDLFHAGYQTEWAVLRDLIEWGCELVVKNPAGEGERQWFRASIAAAMAARDALLLLNQVDGAAQKERGSQHLRHARERFPDDPHWRLADAVAREFPLMTEGVRDAPGMTDREAFSITSAGRAGDSEAARVEALRRERQRQVARKALVEEFVALADVPAIAAEARVHAGYQLFVARRFEEALEQFSLGARVSDDVHLRYLAHFLSGRVFDVQQNAAEAEASYRRALEALPDVQSGAEALARRLFVSGRPDDAYVVIDRAFAASPRPADPWRLYLFGDYRLWPELIAGLHAYLK